MKLALPAFLKRGGEDSSLARRLGCGVQVAAIITLATLLITYLHARALVLYGPTDQPHETFQEMGVLRRLGIFLSGYQLPRPVNVRTPGDLNLLFRQLEISGEGQGQRLEAWFLPHEQPEGLALVFHDYGQAKADVLEVAMEFHDMRLAVLVADLRASGESEGQETSLGWHEAEDVARVALRANDYQPAGGLRVLYGLGTGAAAVLRAVADLEVTADALVVEGVFADVVDVFAGHIGATSMVRWPTARISRYWAGYSMGFPAHELRPVDFATRISVPTLVLVATKDPTAGVMGSTEEAAREVMEALKGPKKLVALAGGRPIALEQPDLWLDAVQAFLTGVAPAAIPAPSGEVGPIAPPETEGAE